jgi:uncharacterized membrane protein
MSRWRLALALLFMLAGALHFLETPLYVRVMPPYLPHPRELVYVSGIAEILGGCGVLAPQVRRAAGWGLILLLVAVFPANVRMAQDSLRSHGFSVLTVVLLLRLPLQAVLIAWVERATRREAAA